MFGGRGGIGNNHKNLILYCWRTGPLSWAIVWQSVPGVVALYAQGRGAGLRFPVIFLHFTQRLNMSLFEKGKIRIDLDDKGFMLDPDQWNDKVAEALASDEGIEKLTEDH